MTFGVRLSLSHASVDTHLNYLFGVQIGQCHIQYQPHVSTRKPKYKLQVAWSTHRDLRVSMKLHDRQLKLAPNFSKKCNNLGKNGTARHRRPINHCVVQRDNPQKIVLTITL